MTWGEGTDTTIVTADPSPPVRRSMTVALLAPILAGLVWAAINGAVVWINVHDPVTTDDVSLFFLGLGVVVLGAIGFVVVLIPTLLGLWAHDDVSRLGSATFSAIVAALGGAVWAWGTFSSSDLEPGAMAALRVSALVLFIPAGAVVWAWREWAQG